MATKKTTTEIIESWPDYKQKGFSDLWDFRWRIGSNKKQSAEAFDKWVTQDNIHAVVEGARQYTNRMRGNAYIKGCPVWINNESWHDDLPPERGNLEKSEATTEICLCGEPATHLKPETLCNQCYAKKYSKQNYDGDLLPYQFVLAKVLKDAGLEIQEGESDHKWQERLRKHTMRRIGGVLQRHAPGQKSQGDVAERKRNV